MLSEVDYKTGNIVFERIESNPRISIDVNLTDLHESTKECQDGKTFRNEFARQRIENSINSTSIGDFHDLICKLQRSRIQHMWHTDITKHRSFFDAACCRKDLQSQTLCDLNRGHSHATDTGMDQDAFAFLHSRQFIKRIVGGKEDGRQCGCITE